MPIASLEDIPSIVADIYAHRKQVVTFGLPTDIAQPFTMPFKYALVPDIHWQGEHNVYKPFSSLQQEDPQQTIVVTCTSLMEEIADAVARYGDFTVINYFTLDYINRFLPILKHLPKEYVRTHKIESSKRALIVRGAYMDDNGYRALQKFAADHPNDHIIISTWDTISVADKQKLESVCDRLVLNAKPDISPGFQNCNLQLTNVHAGIRAAMQSGAEKILLARTDYLFSNPFMLDAFDSLLAAYPATVTQMYGLKGRLIVTDLGTRHYMPYHVADMLMYGYAEDVARYWFASQYSNERNYSHSVFSTYAERSILDFSQDCPVNETWFALNFQKFIGRPIEWTLGDSLTFYRDFLLVVNSLECGLFWFKKLWINRVDFLNKPKSYITHTLWLAMASGRPIEDFADADLKAITWSDFTRV